MGYLRRGPAQRMRTRPLSRTRHVHSPMNGFWHEGMPAFASRVIAPHLVKCCGSSERYAAFIENELKAENDRRDSVNARAGLALTGSTGLVTLVLAVSAVFVGKDFVLSGWARFWLAAALICLLSAAICAVVAGYPWASTVRSANYLQSLLDDHWEVTEVAARNITASCNVDTLRSLRTGTAVKFRFLMGAGAFQALAAAALVVCTLLVV